MGVHRNPVVVVRLALVVEDRIPVCENQIGLHERAAILANRRLTGNAKLREQFHRLFGGPAEQFGHGHVHRNEALVVRRVGRVLLALVVPPGVASLLDVALLHLPVEVAGAVVTHIRFFFL